MAEYDKREPIIQVRNRSAFGDRTENVRIEGNRIPPTVSYVELWEQVLVPQGGLEGFVLESCLYVAGVALSVSIGSWVVIICKTLVFLYVSGGALAAIMDTRLTPAWVMRTITLAAGFLLSQL